MKCSLKTVFLFFFAFSLPGLHSQDADRSSQWLLILEILNDCDTSISSLETNTASSSKIISGLQKEAGSMRAIIKTQQNELQQEQTNSRKSEEAMQTKLQHYEATLQSLEKSLTELQRGSKEKDGKILKLTETISKMKTAIFIMGGILLVILVCLIIRFVLRVKGGTPFL